MFWMSGLSAVGLKQSLPSTCLLAATLLAVSLLTAMTHAAQSTPRFRPTGLRIYYGGKQEYLERLSKEMRAGEIVVLEPRALTPQAIELLVRRANQVGAKILAYISVGELEDYQVEKFHQHLLQKELIPAADKSVLDSITVVRNEQFKSTRVDVRSPLWRTYVLSQVEAAYRSGVHGLFLDTVDTVDGYITNQQWSAPRRIESVKAMMALIKLLKAQDREKYVLQNRGLNLIGAKVFIANGVEIDGMSLRDGNRSLPDGILWENAFAHEDAWSVAKRDELAEIRKRRTVDVFALGYQASISEQGPLRSPAEFFRKSRAYGFSPSWAASSEKLHERPTELSAP